MVGCEATSCGDLHSVMLEYTKDARFVKRFFTFPPNLNTQFKWLSIFKATAYGRATFCIKSGSSCVFQTSFI